MTLDDFNRAPVSEAETAIAHCVALPEWGAAMVAARPYASLAALCEQGNLLAQGWDETALQRALAAHPRIGEKAPGEGKEAQLSRNEQARVSDTDEAIKDALKLSNHAYEQRFGRVFLIRAKGRSAEEILAELIRRLALDAQTERQEALGQLREITLLRLQENFQ